MSKNYYLFEWDVWTIPIYCLLFCSITFGRLKVIHIGKVENKRKDKAVNNGNSPFSALRRKTKKDVRCQKDKENNNKQTKHMVHHNNIKLDNNLYYFFGKKSPYLHP